MTPQEASEKYHWFVYNEETGEIDIFLDHHSLSSFRMCESYFDLSILKRIKPKKLVWNLDFGLLWHEMMDRFYKTQADKTYSFQQWINDGILLWAKAELDEKHAEHKMLQALGGCTGFVKMMAEYAEHFGSERERLRVLGTELFFGREKEVPCGSLIGQGYKTNLYLTGRLDFLMDNGYAIGPLDHKTSAFFRGSPVDNYDPQEGMTGYIYASRYIVQNLFPELAAQRKVDRIWMSFAQVAPAKDDKTSERFKRIPIFKTDFQLENWRVRQLRTAKKIVEMILNDETPDWNASMCANMFHRECQFKNLHRQGTANNMLTILNTDFIVGEEWNPNKPDVKEGE